MDRKVIIAFIIALIAIIVVGFVALNFVPTGDVLNVNVSGNMSEMTENSSINLSQGPIETELNVTPNDTDVDDIDDVDDNDTNSSSDEVDPGDVLHKQTFTISKNETGQNAGMEPGTYVMYYTENDGPIKIEKVN